MNRNLVFSSTIMAGLIVLSAINVNMFAMASSTTETSAIDQAKERLNEAIAALEQGDIIEALELVKQAVRILSVDTAMNFDEAITSMQSGDINGALMHLGEAIKALQTANSEEALMHITEALKSLE
ncbi:MAG: hypothetical protein M3162_07165 [Thermoproteota archaeon]|nr:hypothetical protein [Thermoproteota archaeon]